MNRAIIIDADGNKIQVNGIYYISNNSYYFIYSKGEIDEANRFILYVVKILKEVTNSDLGPRPTGYLIGMRISDDNEYNMVKRDISNIVDEKTNNKEVKVRYLDLSMLSNLKIKDSRSFKLSSDIYNKIFVNDSNSSTNIDDDYKTKYEQLLIENEQLHRKIDLIKDVLK